MRQLGCNKLSLKSFERSQISQLTSRVGLGPSFPRQAINESVSASRYYEIGSHQLTRERRRRAHFIQ